MFAIISPKKLNSSERHKYSKIIAFVRKKCHKIHKPMPNIKIINDPDTYQMNMRTRDPFKSLIKISIPFIRDLSCQDCEAIICHELGHLFSVKFTRKHCTFARMPWFIPFTHEIIPQAFLILFSIFGLISAFFIPKWIAILISLFFIGTYITACITAVYSNSKNTRTFLKVNELVADQYGAWIMGSANPLIQAMYDTVHREVEPPFDESAVAGFASNKYIRDNYNKQRSFDIWCAWSLGDREHPSNHLRVHNLIRFQKSGMKAW